MATYGTLDNENGMQTSQVTIRAVEEGTKEQDKPNIQTTYQNLRTARSIDDKAKFATILYGIFCTSVIFSIFLAILNLIPLYMLILGFVHLHDCPAERLIPIYLIVDGIFFFARFLAFCSYRFLHKKYSDDYHLAAAKQAPALNLINLFLFVWLICGSFWVFGANPDLDNANSLEYCDKLTYLSASAYIVVQWLVLPVVLVVACCAMSAVFVDWPGDDGSDS